MLNHRTNSPAFRAEVIKALLFDTAVSPEFSARYGVTPGEIRQWIDQALETLEESRSQPQSQCFGILTDEEINCLLKGPENDM